MDIKQLITFTTFVKEKSYNKAAQRLNYSVSTLISHISALEEEFHVELVHTQGRKSVLTPDGEKFLPYAEQMIDLYLHARDDMVSSGWISGALRITTTETFGYRILGNISESFTKKNPHVTMNFHINAPETLPSQLENDQADIAFYQDFHPIAKPGIESTFLGKEPVLLVSSPKHMLAKQEKVLEKELLYHKILIARKEYLENPVIYRILNMNKSLSDTNYMIDSGFLMMQMLKDGKTLAFLPLTTVREEINNGSLVNLMLDSDPINISFYASWKLDSPAITSIEALIDFVQTEIDITPSD